MSSGVSAFDPAMAGSKAYVFGSFSEQIAAVRKSVRQALPMLHGYGVNVRAEPFVHRFGSAGRPTTAASRSH
eukprot:2120411-Alexandrium_andersonii.AAC.1